MPCQKGDEGCQKHNYEKREAGNPRSVPSMRDEDVQDWEGLKLILQVLELLKKLGTLGV